MESALRRRRGAAFRRSGRVVARNASGARAPLHLAPELREVSVVAQPPPAVARSLPGRPVMLSDLALLTAEGAADHPVGVRLVGRRLPVGAEVAAALLGAACAEDLRAVRARGEAV